MSLNIGIIKTSETALAANKLPLDVFGQTKAPVTVSCPSRNGVVKLQLGIMLVVCNLGTCCIIGEPGKHRNNLICLPKQKLVLVSHGNDAHQIPYVENNKHSLVRTVAPLNLAPGEHFAYQLPDNLKTENYVVLTPRISAISWLKPAIVQPSAGIVSNQFL